MFMRDVGGEPVRLDIIVLLLTFSHSNSFERAIETFKESYQTYPNKDTLLCLWSITWSTMWKMIHPKPLLTAARFQTAALPAPQIIYERKRSPLGFLCAFELRK